jgi:hypothetical protein
LIPGREGSASALAWTLPAEMPAVAITGRGAVDLGRYAPRPQALSMSPSPRSSSSSASHPVVVVVAGPRPGYFSLARRSRVNLCRVAQALVLYIERLLCPKTPVKR